MTTVKIEKKQDLKFCHHRRVLSSAKLHTSDFFMEKIKSLINILNKRGPRIDPCEPLLMSEQELNGEPILSFTFQHFG